MQENGPHNAQQGLGVVVRLSVRGCKRTTYSRDNFKLNRTAALTEWRQLLSA